MWETSRGGRELELWARALNLCRETGTLIYITSQDTVYDTSKSQDWKSIAGEGIDNVMESERLSLRVKRAYSAAYAAGKPMGRTPWGFSRSYTATREPEQHPHPDRAPLVAEIIGRIAKSEPIARISDDLFARGIASPSGQPRWTRISIVSLVSPAYLGKRRVNGQLVDANWPALISEDLYFSARRVLGHFSGTRDRI